MAVQSNLLDIWNEESSTSSSLKDQSLTTISTGTLRSREIIQQSTIFDSEEKDAMLKKMVAIMQSNIPQLIQIRQQVDRAIQEFYQKSREANEKFERYVAEFDQLMTSSQQFTPQQLDSRKFVADLLKQLAESYRFNAQALMELQNRSWQVKLGQYHPFFELMFFEREKELQLMAQRVEILRQQENHELACAVALHHQALKIEEQYFSQFLQQEQWQANEREQTFRRQFDEQKQNHQENIDLKKLEIEKEKLNVKRIEIENEKEIDCFKMDLREYQIDADKRIQLAEAVRRQQNSQGECLVS